MTNKYLLKVLGISDADIARYAGVTRQAIHGGSGRINEHAAELIAAAKFDPEKMKAAWQAKRELDSFLKD